MSIDELRRACAQAWQDEKLFDFENPKAAKRIDALRRVQSNADGLQSGDQAGLDAAVAEFKAIK